MLYEVAINSKDELNLSETDDYKHQHPRGDNPFDT